MLVTNLLLLASLVLAAPVPIIEFDPTSLGYLNLYLEHFTKIMNERIPSYSISEKFDPIQVLDSGSIKSTVDLGVCNADAEIGFTLKNLVGLKNFRFAEFKMLSGGFFDDGDERGFRTTDSLKGLPTNVTVEIEGFVAAKCGNLEESKKYTASIDVRQLVIELNATSTVVEIAGGAQQSINITFKDFKVTDLNLDYHYAKIVLDKSPDDVFDPLLEFVQFTLQAIFKDKMLEYVEPYMKPKIQALIDSKMPVTFEGKNWPIPMQEE